MFDGQVSITLAGAPATLMPTLGAALRLTSLHGSFGALLGKLELYDLKAAADVVHHGLGRPDADMKRTTEEVFSTGLVGLTPDLIGYVIRLANGGKRLSDTEEGAKDGGPFAG